VSTEGDRMARKTARVVLFGGMLDGHETDIMLDDDGQPPLERLRRLRHLHRALPAGRCAP
jgi:hypothetical protein